MKPFEWAVLCVMCLLWWEIRCMRHGYDPVIRFFRDRFGRKMGRDFV